jgi:hypothetical protein
MGILADSPSDDLDALRWVLSDTLRAWVLHCQTHPDEKVRIELNSDYLPHLSVAGGLILEKKFLECGLVDRLSTLLVVATCSPVFSIVREGKPVNNLEQRRIIIGIFGLAIIRTALRLCTPMEGVGSYTFSGVNDMGRFLSFCECLDAVEITTIAGGFGPDKASFDHALNVLAKDIIAISMFIQPGIIFVPGAPEPLDCMIFPEVPQLLPKV